MVSKEPNRLPTVHSHSNGNPDKTPATMTVRSVLLNRNSPDIESRLKRRRNRTQQVRFKDLEDGDGPRVRGERGSPHPNRKSPTAVPNWREEAANGASVVGAVRGNMEGTIGAVAAFLKRAPPHPLTPGPTRRCWVPGGPCSLTLPLPRQPCMSTAIQTSPSLQKPPALSTTHTRSQSLGDYMNVDWEDEDYPPRHVPPALPPDCCTPGRDPPSPVPQCGAPADQPQCLCAEVDETASPARVVEPCSCSREGRGEGHARPQGRRRKFLSRAVSDPGEPESPCALPAQTALPVNHLPKTVPPCNSPPWVAPPGGSPPQTLSPNVSSPQGVPLSEPALQTVPPCNSEVQVVLPSVAPAQVLPLRNSPPQTVPPCTSSQQTVPPCISPTQIMPPFAPPPQTLSVCASEHQNIPSHVLPPQAVLACISPTHTEALRHSAPEAASSQPLPSCSIVAQTVTPLQTVTRCTTPSKTVPRCTTPSKNVSRCTSAAHTVPSCTTLPQTVLSCPTPAETVPSSKIPTVPHCIPATQTVPYAVPATQTVTYCIIPTQNTPSGKNSAKSVPSCKTPVLTVPPLTTPQQTAPHSATSPPPKMSPSICSSQSMTSCSPPPQTQTVLPASAYFRHSVPPWASPPQAIRQLCSSPLAAVASPLQALCATQDRRERILPPPPPPPPPYTPRKEGSATQGPAHRRRSVPRGESGGGERERLGNGTAITVPHLGGGANAAHQRRDEAPPPAPPKCNAVKATCQAARRAIFCTEPQQSCANRRPSSAPCQRAPSVPPEAQADTLRQVQELLGGLVSGAKCKLDLAKAKERLLGPNGPLYDIGSLQTQLHSLEGVLETSQNTIKVLLDVIQDLEKKEAERDGRHSYRTGQDIENCGTCRDCACIIYSVEHDFRLQEGQVTRSWRVPEPQDPEQPSSPQTVLPRPRNQESPQSVKKSRRKCFWFL